MPATILFLSANPSGTERLELDEEYRDIEDERRRARLRDQFELRPVLAARIDDVRRALVLHKPTVVHFGGHGQHAGSGADGRNVRPVPGAGGPGERTELLLNDDAGRPAPVPIEALAELFRLEGGSVRCVVLNACNSLEQARAIAKHMSCAIGTASTITDQAALIFSTWFYGKLFDGGSLQEAFDLGRNGVAQKARDNPRVFELCERTPGTAEKIRLAELPKVQFRMPFARNPSFVGRDDELARLHRKLQDPQAGGRRPVMFTGMGGIGKTQLAVAYALKHEESYPDGVYFINAAGDDWRPVLAKLAVDLDLKAENAPEAERQLRLVAALGDYLRARPEALVIFDYVDDPADLATDHTAGFVPANLGCRVLVTTRRRDARFESLDVSVLSEGAAVTLLLSKQGAPESAEERATAVAICRSLGALPLAIALAAAYLDKNPTITFAAYLQRIKNHGALAATDTNRLTPADLATWHVAAVKATLETQWAALENADARQVLETAALLDLAADIPQARLSLLTGLASEAEEGFPIPLDDALREIRALSFVEPLRERDGVRLEPLVWEFVKQKLVERGTFAALAVACGERLGEALRDMDRLHEEVAKRGIDEVLTDLRIGLKLAGAPGRARLEALSRPLDRETNSLRRWDPAKAPGFLLQQLRNRCLDMGLGEVRELAEAKLGEHRWSWLRERFPFSRDSEALVRTLDGRNRSAVAGVAVTSDGHFAVSACADMTLQVGDLATGQVLRTLTGHTGSVIGVTVTADGRFAVSASEDNTLKVWDLATGQVLRTLTGHTGSVYGVAVTADGRFAVSASTDKTLKVWDLATGQVLRTLEGHTQLVRGVAVTSDGRFAVSASHDNTLKVWDLATGQVLRTLEGHAFIVTGVAVTADGHFAVSAAWDGTLKVWDLGTGQGLRTFEGHTHFVYGVAVTSDGRFAVSASEDKTLKVWDLATGQVLRTLEGHTGSVKGVAVTADGRFAVSASEDETLKVWDLATGQALRTLEGHTYSVAGVAVTADGRFAVSASEDTTLKVWDLAMGQVLRTLEGHTSAVAGVAVTADGHFAVSASEDETLKVWDLATGQLLRTLDGHTGPVAGVAVTADGRFAVSAFWDTTLKVWDLVETAQPITILETHTFLTCCATTADAKTILAGGWGGALHVLDWIHPQRA